MKTLHDGGRAFCVLNGRFHPGLSSCRRLHQFQAPPGQRHIGRRHVQRCEAGGGWLTREGWLGRAK
eukprot:365901-Chlamydomonas_euryale.AAC.4